MMNAVEQVEAVIRRLPRKARQQVAERLNAELWPRSRPRPGGIDLGGTAPAATWPDASLTR